MPSKFRILQQNDGTTVFPITRAEGIYFKDNTTFDKLSFFPVGAIYISTEDTSPSQLFGGVWEKIEGVFLLGSSSSYTNGSTGGEATHTLSLEEIPSHSHEYTHLTIGSYGGGNATSLLGDRLNSEITQTGSVGSSSPHNNMPPYLSVNMWKRIE